MLNTGAMLAILTTITLDDYYTDQIQEKRQKMKNYADSMKSIGDNVRLWGGSITDTLRDSGRTDLEQSILQGAQELPIYIFAQVIRRQAGSTTKYQKRMIDIAFQNLFLARNMIRPFAVMQRPHGLWKRRWVFRRSIAEPSGTILSKRWTLRRPEMIC